MMKSHLNNLSCIFWHLPSSLTRKAKTLAGALIQRQGDRFASQILVKYFFSSKNQEQVNKHRMSLPGFDLCKSFRDRSKKCDSSYPFQNLLCGLKYALIVAA